MVLLFSEIDEIEGEDDMRAPQRQWTNLEGQNVCVDDVQPSFLTTTDKNSQHDVVVGIA